MEWSRRNCVVSGWSKRWSGLGSGMECGCNCIQIPIPGPHGLNLGQMRNLDLHRVYSRRRSKLPRGLAGACLRTRVQTHPCPCGGSRLPPTCAGYGTVPLARHRLGLCPQLCRARDPLSPAHPSPLFPLLLPAFKKEEGN